MPGAGGLGEGKGDRSAGSRLAAEGCFLDQRNGGGSSHREAIGQSAGLAVGISDGDVARAQRSGGTDGDVGGELSGRVEGAGVHGNAGSKAASGAALEVAAAEDDAAQILALSPAIRTDRSQRGRG